MLRARNCSRRSEGLSAQWRSSSTRTIGWRRAALRRNVAMLSNNRKRACSGSGGARAHVGHQRARIAIMHVLANGLHPRPECRRALAFVASAPQRLRVAEPRVGDGLLGHAGLPDAGLAPDQNEAAASGDRVLHGGAQLLELALAPD